MSPHRLALVFALCVAWLVAGCAPPDARDAIMDGAARSDATGASVGTDPPRVSVSPARATVPVSAPFDVSAVIERVHFAYRPEGEAWVGGHASYSVRVDADGVSVTPFGAPTPEVRARGATRERARSGAPLRLVTAAVERGGRFVRRASSAAHVEQDGHLAIDRGAVIEHLRNTTEGVEQAWSFATAPAGRGDLTVRVRVTGQRYRATTDGGLHFADASSGLGLRYGHATWVDARGTRTPVRARWTGGAIEMTVPAGVVEATAFPATLDPVVGPEVGVDIPAITPSGQTAPAVAFNGSTWLVVWSDVGGVMTDIHGARVDADGRLLDFAGIPITQTAATLREPRVASNGTDFLVTWTANFYQVRGARVSAAGAVLGSGVDGFAISGDTSPRVAEASAVTSDGSGYVVTWGEDDGTTSVIRAARVSAAGAVLDAGGVELTRSTFMFDMPSRCARPAVACDGSAYLVVWAQRTPTGDEIQGARVGVDGVRLGPEFTVVDGLDLGAEIGDLKGPAVAFDGSQYLVAWTERRSGIAGVYGRRVSTTGAVLDATSLAISRTADMARLDALTNMGGNVLAVWTQQLGGVAGGGYDVRGARVAGDGAVLDSGGFNLAASSAREEDAAVACGGGACLVAWKRTESDTGEMQTVRAVKIDATGTVLDPVGVTFPGTANSEYVPSVAHVAGSYLTCWLDVSAGYQRDVRCAQMTESGVMLTPHGIVVASNNPDLYDPPRVTSDGSGFLVVWNLSFYSLLSGVYCARVDGVGAVLDSSPLRLSWSRFGLAARAAGNAAGYLVAWSEPSAEGYAVLARRVSAAGALLDPGAITVYTGPGIRSEVTVGSDGTDYLVAWTDDRDGLANIYGARVGADGTVLDPGSFAVSNAADVQSSPAVSFDGASYLVAWVDSRNGTDSDIYASRVTPTGTVLDVAGLALVTGSSYQRIGGLAWDGTHHVATWRDDTGAGAVRATQVRSNGTVVEPTGFEVAAGGSSPNVASNGHGQSFVVYSRAPSAGASPRVYGRFLGASGGAATCTSGAECASGFCVDGYCCDTACGGGATDDCQACSVAAGAAVNGTCGPVASGRMCRAATGACDVAEACDGASVACPADEFAVDGTVCASPAGGACAVGTCACPSGQSNCGGVCAATGAACSVGVGACARGGVTSCASVGAPRVLGVSGGDEHGCVWTADGGAWCWGRNEYGELGDGTTMNRLTPARVSGLTGVTQLAAGVARTCALRNDGTVWCWGSNAWGGLGDGTTTDRATPVQVSGLTNVSRIHCGYHHTCAVRNDQTVWCWGNNDAGELGDGTRTFRSVPVRVSELTNVTRIAGGGAHTCAVRSDGSVWCWGYGHDGQLGDGGSADQSLPVRFGTVADAIRVTCGYGHTCALRSDGSVWCVGANQSGQLGDGTTTNRTTPVQVTSLLNVTEVDSWTMHTCARTADGTVWCWGLNNVGQLGNNTFGYGFDSATPVRVNGLTDVIHVDAGHFHSCAVRGNGVTLCWGHNTHGQLGDGTTTQRNEPVQVLNVSAPTTCGATSGTPTTETCNGADDDCDGSTDEDLAPLTCGVGACQHTVAACSGGVAQTCTPGTPAAETCNNLDDDCDGTPDGPTAAASCPSVAHATPACVAGACGFACDAGYADCNGNASDGCELAVGGACSPSVCATGHVACVNGASACVGDGFVAAGTECRPPAGVCDAAETCTGDAPDCPVDGYAPATVVCRAAAGACDAVETCTGLSPSCPVDARAATTVVCRAAVGACDLAETCDGTSVTCPANRLAPAATVCRGAAGACDAIEVCTGASAQCPADGFTRSGTLCRAAAGTCDLAESCTGTSAACPTDAFRSSSYTCRASTGVCDAAEKCTGSAAACPLDRPAAAGTTCRAAASGGCDVAETCNGTAFTCPTDARRPAGYVCRAATSGGCDVAETCDGASVACPADAVRPSGAVCRATTGACDVAETCNGTTKTCAPNRLLAAGAVCRAAAGVCDVAETCSGTSAACPTDRFAANSVVCRAPASACDAAEKCPGNAAACPADRPAAAGTTCRASAGGCDVAETCDGASFMCPTDVLRPRNYVCRAASGVCDAGETCDGANAACPIDAVRAAGAVCRAATGTCDVAEVCDGAAKTCPANRYAPVGAYCDDGNVCTTGSACNGTSATCPTTSNGMTVACATGRTCNRTTCCTSTSTSCNDNDPCTQDTCAPSGGCLSVPVDCDDDDPCTADACDPVRGCTHTQVPFCVTPRVANVLAPEETGDAGGARDAGASDAGGVGDAVTDRAREPEARGGWVCGVGSVGAGHGTRGAWWWVGVAVALCGVTRRRGRGRSGAA